MNFPILHPKAFFPRAKSLVFHEVNREGDLDLGLFSHEGSADETCPLMASVS